MKHNSIELTLCYQCYSIYRDMPDRYIRRKDKTQTIKEPCDICHRFGYDYEILDREVGRIGKRRLDSD